MATMQIPLFQLAPRAPRQKRLPDITRGRHHGNEQSEAANTRIHSRKSEWYPEIIKEARRNREAGITLAEFVERWNRERRYMRPFHSIKPNDVSGRFTELGLDLKLFRVEKPGGGYKTRGGRHAIWWAPEFVPKAGAQ